HLFGRTADDVAHQVRSFIERDDRHHIRHHVGKCRTRRTLNDGERVHRAVSGNLGPSEARRAAMRADRPWIEMEFAAGLAARHAEPVFACGCPIGLRGRVWGRKRTSVRWITHGWTQFDLLPRINVQWTLATPPLPWTSASSALAT